MICTSYVLVCFVFFFFKQKTAYEMLRSLVGSEMCIRDRGVGRRNPLLRRFRHPLAPGPEPLTICAPCRLLHGVFIGVKRSRFSHERQRLGRVDQVASPRISNLGEHLMLRPRGEAVPELWLVEERGGRSSLAS